ncbi:hypothetical protein ASPZODRAFT_1314200 [Penicilliopsis zonata CBS 506.65]|uniref:ATP-grasp domain-containing protein n=1 Tax=Penicilliopsis zonata CBS 506.65 TaxID=1073090 RepID=A0A1L9S5I2_9EURO|nr:hypothetical protein ASPZODRAFT_1314200 [Penicilliopsis zonata CBS 506.65]OJJ42415.1 hypothetical protein ASPZODRAFT_1314200 [Penicilliopsis zonata CBS 506.65]
MQSIRSIRSISKTGIRHLSLLEHRSHRLLKDYSIPTPHGFVVSTPEEAEYVVTKIGMTLCSTPCQANCVDAPSVLKSQIQAGGRGKGRFDSDGKSGIRIVGPEEAYKNAANMLDHRLTTKQTPADGLLVQKLYIYRAVDVQHEFYLALTLDRERGSPLLLISAEGGVNIESNTESLHAFALPLSGIPARVVEAIQEKMGFTRPEMDRIAHLLRQMFRLFREKDALLLELNPLVRTPDGEFIVLDAKCEIDPSAQFRQQDLFHADAAAAEPAGLSYIKLDGNIGNIVNGAGLAMATNDLISLFGGKSANFLDIGGKATEETLLTAFRMLESGVDGILINIFGGIVRCDMIAQAIVSAAEKMDGFKVPVVVRLQGTNCEEALKLIESSGLEVHTETDLEEAAKKIVQLVNK